MLELMLCSLVTILPDYLTVAMCKESGSARK